MVQIDAHHHFWHPARGDYGWMPQDDPVLTRPYHPADLSPALAETGVGKTVLVQAAPTVEETEYLLGIADCTPHVAKVVGWVDFEDSREIDTLRRLARHPKFSGVRPMIQDIAQDDWMLRADVQWAYQALNDLDLTFDCLGFPRHIPHFLTLLQRYPGMRAVLDHCLKPQIHAHSEARFQDWAQGMTRLAKETPACIKLSGLVTESDENWSFERLQPYVHHVLESFGADRVMWGSDWPVVRLRCEYAEWHALSRRLTDHLSGEEQDRIFAGTAASFYRI